MRDFPGIFNIKHESQLISAADILKDRSNFQVEELRLKAQQVEEELLEEVKQETAREV